MSIHKKRKKNDDLLSVPPPSASSSTTFEAAKVVARSDEGFTTKNRTAKKYNHGKDNKDSLVDNNNISTLKRDSVFLISNANRNNNNNYNTIIKVEHNDEPCTHSFRTMDATAALAAAVPPPACLSRKLAASSSLSVNPSREAFSNTSNHNGSQSIEEEINETSTVSHIPDEHQNEVSTGYDESMEVVLASNDPKLGSVAAQPSSPLAAAAVSVAPAPKNADSLPARSLLLPSSPAVNRTLEEKFSTTRNTSNQTFEINQTNNPAFVLDKNLDNVTKQYVTHQEPMKVEPSVDESVESKTTTSKTTHLNSVAPVPATPFSPTDIETIAENTSMPCDSILNRESTSMQKAAVGGVITSPPTICKPYTTPTVKPELAESSAVSLASIPPGESFDKDFHHEEAPIISQSLRPENNNLCLTHGAKIQNPCPHNAEVKSILLEPQMDALYPMKTTQLGRPKNAGPPVPVWEGPPDDPLDGGWPPGWIKRKFKRRSGKTAGTFDFYWYTPKNRHTLRSMVEVRNFMKHLLIYNGDEKMAYKNRKTVKDPTCSKSEKALPQTLQQRDEHCATVSAANARSRDQQQVQPFHGSAGEMRLSFTVPPPTTNDMTRFVVANTSNLNQHVNQQPYEWQHSRPQFPQQQQQQQYDTQCDHSYPRYNHHIEPHTQYRPHENQYGQFQHSHRVQPGPRIPHERHSYTQSTYSEYQDPGHYPAHTSPQREEEHPGYWAQPTDYPLPPRQRQQGNAPQWSHIYSQHRGHNNHDHQSYPRTSPLPSEWEGSLSFWY